MARAIDADNVLERIENIAQHWQKQGKKYEAMLVPSVMKSIIDSEPTLTPPNEWVSVDERFPEKHSEYIVCACDEGEPIDERIWGDTVVVCADYYDGAFTWYEGNTEYDISDIVTHWMPLPAPPDRRPPEGDEDT